MPFVSHEIIYLCKVRQCHRGLQLTVANHHSICLRTGKEFFNAPKGWKQNDIHPMPFSQAPACCESHCLGWGIIACIRPICNTPICLQLATHRASSCGTHRVVTHSRKMRFLAHGTSCATSPVFCNSKEACSEEQATIVRDVSTEGTVCVRG